MSQSTAIDWLQTRYEDLCYELKALDLPMSVFNKKLADLFNQARELEKDQINQACYDGYYQEEPIDVREYYDRIYKK